MNIEEFLNNFNDIIPYTVQLKIGDIKANEIFLDMDLISAKNRKGKRYPLDKKGLLWTTTNYIPLEEMVVPIKLTIQCDYPHILKWEEKSKSTNKEGTRFRARILSEDTNRQLGYLSIDLTPAGDISHKFCSFYNASGTHEIIQSINYHYDEKTKKVTPIESLDFIFYNLETRLEEKVSFHKENGILKCITIQKQGLRYHAFDSVVWSAEKVAEKEEFFSRFCNNSQVLSASSVVCDMTNYIINKDFITRFERIEELKKLLSYEHTSNFHYDYDKIREELEYLSDPKNDIFNAFYGEYVGNTVIKEDSKLSLVVETVKDEYHYFTCVDITDTNAFDIDFYHQRKDGTAYYCAIENSPKIPMFRIKIENGKEVLVPLKDSITPQEITNFDKFKSFCEETFGEIESKKLATFSLGKYATGDRGYQFVKTKKDTNPRKVGKKS